MKRLLLLLCFFASPAFAQLVQQSGNVTPGHATCWAVTGVVYDCGTPGGSSILGPFTANDLVAVNGSGSLIDSGINPTTTSNWSGLLNLNGGATAPTRANGDASTNLATTAFVQNFPSSGASFDWTGLQQFGTPANLGLFALYNVYNTTGTAQITAIGSLTGVACGTSANLAAVTGTAPVACINWAFVDGRGPQVNQPAWAGYHEVRQYQGSTGYGFGVEVEATNLTTSTHPNDPYGYAPAAATIGINLGSGGQCGQTMVLPCPDYLGVVRTPTSATVGINIVGNTANFISGINFAYNSLFGADGSDTGGSAQAINFPRNHFLNWWTCPGAAGACAGGVGEAIKFTFGMAATSSSITASLLYDSSGLTLYSTAPVFRVVPVTTAANFVQINAAQASSSPTILGTGTDSTVGLVLSSKSTGEIFIDGGNSSVIAARFTPTASGVNWLHVTAATTGNPTLVAAQGGDTNVGLTLSAQLAAAVTLSNSVGSAILDASGNWDPSSNNAFTLGLSGTRWANVFSVLGNFSGAITGGGLIAGAGIQSSADPGGTASTNTMSSVASSTISSGTGTVKMSTANSANNTGWLKFYCGTSVCWVPAWVTNAP